MNSIFRSIVLVCLLLVAGLVVLSAYIRLNHAGLGCAAWPSCYGHIGSAESQPSGHSTADTVSAYQQLAKQPHIPQGWASAAHRLIASLLGVGVITLVVAALARRHKDAPLLIPLLLLALTIFLAVLGNWSGGLHRPVVVLGNLFGGFGMLALLWILWLRSRRYSEAVYGAPRNLRVWSAISLLVLCVQILLGSLTSANFAALACTSFPDCHGAWLLGSGIAAAFDVLRILPVNAAGVVSTGEKAQAIHMAHRLGAWLSVAVLGWTAVQAIRTGGIYRGSGITIILLLSAEIVIGIGAVITGIPIALATAHNGLAALLLLSVLTLHYKTRNAAPCIAE